MTSPFEHISSHLDELRRRILICFLAVFICSVAAYMFAEPIAGFFIAPLFKAQPAMAKLVYTNLTEAFVAYLKVSLLVGLIFSFPIVLYESWMFISPGLLPHEKKLARQVVFWATLLFAGGASFAFFIVLPRVLSFFMGFTGANLEALPKLGGYLTFVARTSLAFGLAFEIPFLMVAATKAGLVKKDYFRNKRKYYYPLILVLAALLTAGDLFGAVLLTLPLFGLYEAGIAAIRMLASPA